MGAPPTQNSGQVITVGLKSSMCSNKCPLPTTHTPLGRGKATGTVRAPLGPKALCTQPQWLLPGRMIVPLLGTFKVPGGSLGLMRLSAIPPGQGHQGDQTGNHPRDLPPAGLCPGSTRIQNGLYTSYTYIRSHPQAPCPPHPLHASHPPYNAHISRACQPCPLPNVTCCQRNRSGGI